MSIMNISLAILHEDKQYRESFLRSFGKFYPQTEVFSFSTTEYVIKGVSHKPVDVLLISENIYNAEKDILTSEKIKCRTYIILTKGRGRNKIGSYPAVCQYQMIDNLYQEIIGIYAEHTDAVLDLTSGAGRTRVYTFMSGAGGCGCSVSCAAYAMYLASKGSKAVYVDMSSLGVPEMMFEGEGSYSMTDCFTAVISRKNNLNIQLETYSKKDISGVHFYSSCANSLDWADITYENREDFLNCLISDSSFDCVVVDLPCEWNETSAFMYEKSDKFYIISNGKSISNAKCIKLLDAVFTYIRSKKSDPSKIKAVYSDYSENSVKIQDNRIDEYTLLPEIKRIRNTRELLERLSSSDIWER